MELVAMQKPSAVELERLEYARTAKSTKQVSRQAADAGGGVDGVAERLAGELFGEVGSGFMAVDGSDGLIEAA